MDALLLATLQRLASNENFGVLGESTREIVQILEVLFVGMVAIEPRKIRQILGLVLT